MKYNIVVVGRDSDPLVSTFQDQAFEIRGSVTHPNKGTVGFVNQWTGNVAGNTNTISVPAIIFVREDETGFGVRLTMVGGFDKAASTQLIKDAYIDAMNGIITTGTSSNGNTPGGQDGDGGFGFGLGFLKVPPLIWLLAAGYLYNKYKSK